MRPKRSHVAQMIVQGTRSAGERVAPPAARTRRVAFDTAGDGPAGRDDLGHLGRDERLEQEDVPKRHQAGIQSVKLANGLQVLDEEHQHVVQRFRPTSVLLALKTAGAPGERDVESDFHDPAIWISPHDTPRPIRHQRRRPVVAAPVGHGHGDSDRPGEGIDLLLPHQGIVLWCDADVGEGPGVVQRQRR